LLGNLRRSAGAGRTEADISIQSCASRRALELMELCRTVELGQLAPCSASAQPPLSRLFSHPLSRPI